MGYWNVELEFSMEGFPSQDAELDISDQVVDLMKEDRFSISWKSDQCVFAMTLEADNSADAATCGIIDTALAMQGGKVPSWKLTSVTVEPSPEFIVYERANWVGLSHERRETCVSLEEAMHAATKLISEGSKCLNIEMPSGDLVSISVAPVVSISEMSTRPVAPEEDS